MPNNKWVCTYTGRLFSALSTPQSRTGLLVWPPLSARRNHGIDTQLCRHFTTDDTSDRFRHVRDALPRRDPIPEDPVLVAPTELPVERSFEPEAKEPEAKLDRDTLRSIPLETIEDALLKFVPENIRDSSPDDEFLTPGQIFYLENRDKLFDNIRRRYLEETGGKDAAALTDNDIESLLPLLMEDEQYGSYDAEQVVSPGKHHLWDYNTSEVASTRKTVHLTKGQMPTLQQVVDILEQERMANVVVVDMDSCNRRDQAMYCIVATGSTRAHCRRVGRMLYRAIVDLAVPFVSDTAYCCHSRSDEWIVARLGPLCVHLLVKEVRERQSIEDLWAESRAGEAHRATETIEAPERPPNDDTTHAIS